MSICHNCESQLRKDVKFCTKCGVSIEKRSVKSDAKLKVPHNKILKVMFSMFVLLLVGSLGGISIYGIIVGFDKLPIIGSLFSVNEENVEEHFSQKEEDEVLEVLQETNPTGYAYLEVAPLVYDWIYDFQDDFALMLLDNKYGILDKDGKEIAPPKYDEIGENYGTGIIIFCEDLARVNQNGKWGFVDKNGNEIVSLKYDSAEHFYNGYSKVSIGNKESGYKYGVIDKKGKEIIPLIYDAIGSFSEGMISIGIRDKWDGDSNSWQLKWGFADKDGKEVVPFVYDYVGKFSEGLVSVSLGGNSYYSNGIPYYVGKYGFIDKTGREIIPLIYDSVGRMGFTDGMASISFGEHAKNEYGVETYIGKWGFIDKTGGEVISPQYDRMISYHGPNKFGYFPYGLALVSSNGKSELIDKMGKVVEFTQQYDSVISVSSGLIGVMNDDKWGLVSGTGKEIVPLIYSSISEFSDGLAVVGFDDGEIRKYGFIDASGNEVVVPKYDEVWGFADGLAAVRLGDYPTGKWGFIDKTGIEVVPILYSFEIDGHDGVMLTKFSEDLAAIRLNDDETNKWGFVNISGEVIIPFEYDCAMNFSDGMAAVRIGDWENGKWHFIDKSGTQIVPNTFDTIRDFSDGVAIVSLNGKWGIISIKEV